MKHKFHNKPETIDHIRFASKKEAKRYSDLKILQSVGEVVFFLRQTPLHLPGNTKYVCDFTVFWSNGDITFEDVKGVKTDTYKLKKRMVEELYPLTITEL